MGTPDFAVGTLEAIIAAEHEVAGVVTQPDKSKGRSKALVPTPVKEVALKHGIEVFQPKRIRNEEAIAVVKAMNPEVIVVVAFGQIIPKEILDMPPYGCLNVHASLLPAYRGAAPIQWAVLNGDKESGVTIMRMDEGLDTGDMISKVVVPLDVKETSETLFDKLSDAGARLLVETLPKVASGEAVYEKQPAESPTPYAGMISKQMGEIDWSQPAEQIERLVRGMNSWPSAYTKLDGKTMKVWSSYVESDEQMGIPGEIIAADKNGIKVQTGKGVLVLEELQLEGKKRMTADAFLRGYTIKEKQLV